MRVEIGAWVSAGWKMFTAHWKTWVKMGCITYLPLVFPMIGFMAGYFALIFSLVPRMGVDAYGNPVPVMPSGPPIWALSVLGISGLFLFVMGFVSMYFSIGMWKAALKQARGGVPEMSDLRGNGGIFWRVLGAVIVIQLLTTLGAMLCFIPAFIVMGWYYYVLPLVIDKNLSLGEAMTQSKAATSPQLMMFILWAIVVSILASLGSYACYIGLVASAPLHFLLAAVSYRATFEGVNWVQAPPAYPPPAAPPAASY